VLDAQRKIPLTAAAESERKRSADAATVRVLLSRSAVRLASLQAADILKAIGMAVGEKDLAEQQAILDAIKANPQARRARSASPTTRSKSEALRSDSPLKSPRAIDDDESSESDEDEVRAIVYSLLSLATEQEKPAPAFDAKTASDRAHSEEKVRYLVWLFDLLAQPRSLCSHRIHRIPA